MSDLRDNGMEHDFIESSCMPFISLDACDVLWQKDVLCCSKHQLFLPKTVADVRTHSTLTCSSYRYKDNAPKISSLS